MSVLQSPLKSSTAANDSGFGFGFGFGFAAVQDPIAFASENAGLALTEPAVAVTLYGPPVFPLAVKASLTVPAPLVLAVIVFVRLENVPLTPEPEP
jgi:hypothetical protein